MCKGPWQHRDVLYNSSLPQLGPPKVIPFVPGCHKQSCMGPLPASIGWAALEHNSERLHLPRKWNWSKGFFETSLRKEPLRTMLEKPTSQSLLGKHHGLQIGNMLKMIGLQSTLGRHQGDLQIVFVVTEDGFTWRGVLHGFILTYFFFILLLLFAFSITSCKLVRSKMTQATKNLFATTLKQKSDHHKDCSYIVWFKALFDPIVFIIFISGPLMAGVSRVKSKQGGNEQNKRKKQTARTMYLIINFQVSSKGNLHEDHLLDSAWRRWHKQCEGEHGKVAWSAPQWKYVASHLPHQPAHSCTNQEDVHCQHDELHRQSPSKWIEPRALLWLQRLKALLDPHLGQTLEEWDWVAEGKPNVRY